MSAIIVANESYPQAGGGSSGGSTRRHVRNLISGSMGTRPVRSERLNPQNLSSNVNSTWEKVTDIWSGSYRALKVQAPYLPSMSGLPGGISVSRTSSLSSLIARNRPPLRMHQMREPFSPVLRPPLWDSFSAEVSDSTASLVALFVAVTGANLQSSSL